MIAQTESLSEEITGSLREHFVHFLAAFVAGLVAELLWNIEATLPKRPCRVETVSLEIGNAWREGGPYRHDERTDGRTMPSCDLRGVADDVEIALEKGLHEK
jgi:hypothetical protein